MYVGKKVSSSDSVVEIKRSKSSKYVSYVLANDIDWFRTDYLLDTQDFRDADIVHCHNLSGWYFNLGTLVKMSRLKPVVWTLHDMWALTPHCAHTSSFRMRHGLYACSDPHFYPSLLWNNDHYLSWRKSRLYQRLDVCLVSPCQWLDEVVGSTCLSGNARAVIPNGVDVELFHPRCFSEKDGERNPDNRPVVFFLGSNFTENIYKGYADFLWLANHWNGIDVQFIALGAKEDAFDGPVKLLKATTSKALVAQYMANADVFVLPSRHEVFPLVVLEAMSCGVPVVAYDVGGVGEVLNSAPCGDIVPRMDRNALLEATKRILNECLNDREQIASALHKQIRQRFTMGRMVEEYQSLYSRLLQ